MTTVHVPCDEPNCKEEAAFAYVWPWGAQGKCCPPHRVVVGQRAEQLAREVSFSVIDPGRPQPITRDERTALIAARLSAEAELTDAKASGVALYNSNTELADECRRLRARNIEMETQVKDASGKLDTVITERDNALAGLHDAQKELDRLKALVSQPAHPSAKGPKGA